jgi:hypothetical protein
VPWDIRILLNGYTDELAYERGGIANDLPFEETKRRHCVNELAQAYGDDPDFSARIRSNWQTEGGI